MCEMRLSAHQSNPWIRHKFMTHKLIRWTLISMICFLFAHSSVIIILYGYYFFMRLQMKCIWFYHAVQYSMRWTFRSTQKNKNKMTIHTTATTTTTTFKVNKQTNTFLWIIVIYTNCYTCNSIEMDMHSTLYMEQIQFTRCNTILTVQIKSINKDEFIRLDQYFVKKKRQTIRIKDVFAIFTDISS